MNEPQSCYLFEGRQCGIHQRTDVTRGVVLHMHKVIHRIQELLIGSPYTVGATAGHTHTAVDQAWRGRSELLPQVQDRAELHWIEKEKTG